MFDVLTIGSATKDVFLVSKQFTLIRSSEFATGIGECVSLGSKIEVDKLVETTGGGGTNTAVTFTNLGFHTATVTRVGDDAAGRDVLNDLTQRNVDTRFVKTIKKKNTGYSTLLTTEDGERSILVHRGVSGDFIARDFPKTVKARWMYISSLGGNVSLVNEMIRWAKTQKVRVAYNPGSLELKRGLKAFATVLRGVDVLIMNIEEAQMLTETKTRDVKKLASLVGTKGTLILTDGSNGAYAFSGNTRLHARTTGAKSISRTGAGDAFGSGVVAAIMKNMSLEDALRVGTLNAESVVQQFGAKLGILTKWPTKKALQSIRVRKFS